MRIGLQTISWGSRIKDLNDLAVSSKSCGYEGFEFAQKCHTFRIEARELCDLLNSYRLHLVGLAGGSLQSRMAYSADLRPDYLYIDEWDEESVMQAMEEDFTVAIHPHYYKDIDSISTAEAYLKRFPNLKLILDTGHLHLAGDNILDAVERHIDRIAAIHLKDWTSRYGMSPVRFARGFTALGEGNLAPVLEEFVAYLKESQYQGWIIVEQDTAHGDPLECAKISRRWLHSQGL